METHWQLRLKGPALSRALQCAAHSTPGPRHISIAMERGRRAGDVSDVSGLRGRSDLSKVTHLERGRAEVQVQALKCPAFSPPHIHSWKRWRPIRGQSTGPPLAHCNGPRPRVPNKSLKAVPTSDHFPTLPCALLGGWHVPVPFIQSGLANGESPQDQRAGEAWYGSRLPVSLT